MAILRVLVMRVKNLALKLLLKITKFRTTTQYNCADRHKKNQFSAKIKFIQLNTSYLKE
ncbi:hypothetical protein D3C85_1118390 [compost metagenome]